MDVAPFIAFSLSLKEREREKKERWNFAFFRPWFLTSTLKEKNKSISIKEEKKKKNHAVSETPFAHPFVGHHWLFIDIIEEFSTHQRHLHHIRESSLLSLIKLKRFSVYIYRWKMKRPRFRLCWRMITSLMTSFESPLFSWIHRPTTKNIH